jgi:hypothetical protein
MVNISGWWFFATPLKNDGVKVSWDDKIPHICKTIQMFQTTNQEYVREYPHKLSNYALK